MVSQDVVSAFGYDLNLLPSVIKPYMNGRELVLGRSQRLVVDAFGLSDEQLKSDHPRIYQHLRDTVKPERDTKAENNSDTRQYALEWWLFAKPRPELRAGVTGLDRYIATTETAKHRAFSFVEGRILADQKLRVVAVQNAEVLSIMSSRFHVTWADAAGGRQGVGNDPVYNGSRCFDPFPFPDLTEDLRTRLRALGEELDVHRKRQQATHPKLTLTDMYNVLEKLRAGETIAGKDREIYDQGLIGILRDLHDQIDAAVAEAYGWPMDLSDEDILFRLVALNKTRAEEEARGHIRWLRPDYQNPTGAKASKGKTTEMDLGLTAKIEKAPWPKSLPDQIAAVRHALEEMGEATPEQIARRFVRARTTSVRPLLDSLAALGQADKVEEGRYAA